jgi:hypothetical protein
MEETSRWGKGFLDSRLKEEHCVVYYRRLNETNDGSMVQIIMMTCCRLFSSKVAGSSAISKNEHRATSKKLPMSHEEPVRH